MSKLGENWLIYPQNRLNLHDLAVKRGGGQGQISIPYLDPPLKMIGLSLGLGYIKTLGSRGPTQKNHGN